MNTHPLMLENGTIYAFELENIYIQPRRIATILAEASGVSHIKLRKPFSSSSDTHVEFKYHGKDFLVWEPYGDSSRYWIGPVNESDEMDVSSLENCFKQYDIPIVIKFLGDLISLNFKSIFRK